MKSIVIALSLPLLASSALAGEATLFDDTFKSTRTRAEVRAEVIEALARGERLSYGEASFPTYGHVVGAQARAATARAPL
jgi:hypothetical protein